MKDPTMTLNEERIEELEYLVESLQKANTALVDAVEKASFVMYGGKLVIPKGTEIGYLSVYEGAVVMGEGDD